MRHTCLALLACVAAILLGPGCSPSGPTREQAKASGENLLKIGVAMNAHESHRREFPARVLSAPDGQPALSWRVALLPYLGEEALYSQFHLNEPWDSPHNKTLLSKMPAIYNSPMVDAGSGMTNYLAVAGPEGALPDGGGTRAALIIDGTANTAMIVEADKAVPWTSPQDHSWTAGNPAAGLGGLHPKGAFYVGLVSGDVRFLKNSFDPKTIVALFTRDGADLVDWDAIKAHNLAP